MLSNTNNTTEVIGNMKWLPQPQALF